MTSRHPSVCFLTSVHDAFDVRIFHKECKTLVRAGYDLTLVAPHARDETVEGVRIKAVPPPSGRLARMTSTVWKVLRAAVSLDADIYHFHDPELIPVGLLLKMSGKTVIYDVHEYYRRKILSKGYLPALLRRPIAEAFHLLESLASRAFDAILVTDQVTKDRFKGRAECIGNYPLAPPTIRKAVDPDLCFPIVYVGGLTEDRGLFVMIRAMEFVDEPGRLTLIGRFPSARVQEAAQRCRGYDKVRWLGHQPWMRAMEAVAAARLGLLLLQPVPSYSYAGENTTKLFEYMMLGTAVLASDFPNLQRIIEEERCGEVVDPTDPEAVAGSINRLIRNPERLQTMAANGVTAVKSKYNWAHASQLLLELYNRLSAA